MNMKMKTSPLASRTVRALLPAALGLCLVLLSAGCAPFIVPPSDAPAELAFAGDNGGWDKQVASLAAFGSDRVVDVPSFGEDGMPMGPSPTAWTTDDWVFGYRGGRRTVLQMPREPGPDAWGRSHFKSLGWPRLEAGHHREEQQESRFDAGGNVLVSPPIPGYPYGRIITSRQMQPELLKFFRDQKVQASPKGELIELDTAWLKVGHVDELVTFVPVKAGGFRMLLPDAEAGVKLLGTVPAERAVFAAENGAQLVGKVTAAGPRFLEDKAQDFDKSKWKYIRIISGKGAGLTAHVYATKGKRLIIDKSWNLRGESSAATLRGSREGRADSMPIWFEPPDETSRYLLVEDSRMWQDGAGEEFPALMTAGELAGDQFLAAAAKSFDKRIFGPGGVGEVVGKGLGLTEKDVVRIPVLVYDDGEGNGMVALAPNPINLFLLDGSVVLLKPSGPREKPADESTDVFGRAWTSVFQGLGVRPLYLEGWDALHRLDGGAHCGANVVRALPAEKKP